MGIDLMLSGAAALIALAWAMVETRTHIAEPGGIRSSEVLRAVLLPHAVLLAAISVAGVDGVLVAAGSTALALLVCFGMAARIPSPPLRRVLVLADVQPTSLPPVDGLTWVRPAAGEEDEVAVDAVMADLSSLPADQTWPVSDALARGVAVYDTPYLLRRLTPPSRVDIWMVLAGERLSGNRTR